MPILYSVFKHIINIESNKSIVKLQRSVDNSWNSATRRNQFKEEIKSIKYKVGCCQNREKCHFLWQGDDIIIHSFPFTTYFWDFATTSCICRFTKGMRKTSINLCTILIYCDLFSPKLRTNISYCYSVLITPVWISPHISLLLILVTPLQQQS